jgi:CDP-glucose 4,6-dehydratase
VIHLAAQSLVRESYIKPIETYETNAIGTINVLKASQSLQGLQAQLIITTDKVYKNIKTSSGFLETDPLGGSDPYSASKAMADIATQSWTTSFGGVPTAIARAGNVIGGGDICKDRLIPDLVSSFELGVRPKIRAPKSIRPWQHVLDCLNGYQKLINAMLMDGLSGEWNFGPYLQNKHTVAELVQQFTHSWGIERAEQYWKLEKSTQPHEAGYLLLDSNKARECLFWNDELDFRTSIDLTTQWFNRPLTESPREVTINQINEFLSLN